MRHTLVGIDIGTHSTRVVVCEYGEGTSVPNIVATGKSLSRGVRHGYIVNRHEVTKSITQALYQAEKSLKTKIKRAYVAIGGISLTSQNVTSSVVVSKADGEVTELDIKKLVGKSEEAILSQFKNRKIIHTIPQEFKLDGEVVLGKPLGMHGTRLEAKILFVTCLEHHILDLIETIRDAGVDIIDIIAAPLAMSEAALTPRQRAVGCALLDIGAETVTLSVYEDTHLISLEVFPIGSSNITNDIALGFQIPLDEAEKVKTGDSENPTYSKKKIDDIIEARLEDIFELIQNHLKRIKREGMLPAGVIITGGGSTLATINEFAKATLKLPSHVVHVEHVSSARRKINNSSWLVAYGLCFLGSHTSISGFRETNLFAKALRGMYRSFTGFVRQLLP